MYETLDGVAICYITPLTLEYGSVTIYDYSDLSFTLSNVGGDTLVGVIEESCEYYSIVEGGGPYSLLASESLTVTMRFNPTVYGQYDCQVETNSAECEDVICIGYGSYSPALTCAVIPDTLDFGVIDVGEVATMTFDIIHTGYTGTLSGTVSEPHDLFFLSSPDYILTSGQTHTVSVAFYAGEVGMHECVVDTGHDVCTDVYCTAIADYSPICSIEPNSLEFGTVTVNDSLNLSFYITNIGGSVLEGAVTDTCSYFDVVSGSGPYALAGGDTNNVIVRFKPQDEGTLECTIGTGDECVGVYCVGIGEFEGTGIHSSTSGEFAFYQNYPNPFNPSTTIDYDVPVTGRVRIQVYDLRGRLVCTLVDQILVAGRYEAKWDGRDDGGHELPSGMYMSRLIAGGHEAFKRMTLMR